MHHHRGRGAACALALAGVLIVPVIPASAHQPAGAQQPAPDNTKTNQRDRAKGAATADQQKETAADREITQRIRQALMDDKSLSTYAHNVKIITQNGRVTIKGPVRSAEEKQTVAAKATEVAGAGHVTNQISIAPAKSEK